MRLQATKPIGARGSWLADVWCRRASCSLILLVFYLNAFECGDRPVHDPELFLATLPDSPPRRTYARANVDASGCSLSFEQPMPVAIVSAGPVTVVCIYTCALHPSPVVALYHNNIKKTLLRSNGCSQGNNTEQQMLEPDGCSNGKAHLSAIITAEEGAHSLHAVLLDEAGGTTMTMAYAAFVARTQARIDGNQNVLVSGPGEAPQITRLLSLAAQAELACREGRVRDDRGGVRTATSPCDALLQLGHELRLAGDWSTAARLLAQVVRLSAADGREGDRAHATHVYPYLEIAKGALAVGDRDSVSRALTTIQRLQPGYLLPSKCPSEEGGGQRRAEQGEAGRLQGRGAVAVGAQAGGGGLRLRIDAELVRDVDMGRVWHLVCEWTALEFVGPAGMLQQQLQLPHQDVRLLSGSELRAGEDPAPLVVWWDSAVGNPGGHYKLLHHIAAQLHDALIVELGTMHGGSAMALASGHESNRVVTYNVVDDFSTNAAACGLGAEAFLDAVGKAGLQVEFRLQNVLDSEEGMAELLEAALIHIDINHEGEVEDALLQFLAGNGYRGLVLLDDIYLNGAMDRVWGSMGGGRAGEGKEGGGEGRGGHAGGASAGGLPRVCKYDLTDIGHTVAGTGLLDFSCSAVVSVASPFAC